MLGLAVAAQIAMVDVASLGALAAALCTYTVVHAVIKYNPLFKYQVV